MRSKTVRSIFDEMAARRALALVQQKNPVAWKLNAAAIAKLEEDDRTAEAGAGKLGEGSMLFGLPIILGEDRAPLPSFALLEELPDDNV